MAEFEITIDNLKIKTDGTKTILEVARENSIDIPTLCYLKDISVTGSCRVCVVEVEGYKNMVTSCNTFPSPNMIIKTSSEKTLKARKTAIELLLSNHNNNCLSCVKNQKCDLQKLSKQFNCDEERFAGEKSLKGIDLSSKSIVRDLSKCILCGKCVAVCNKRQNVTAIGKIDRGFNTKIGCSFNKGLENSTCVGCGQCVLVCPTGALVEQNEVVKTLNYFYEPNTEVVVMTAPSIRVAIAEEFGEKVGTFSEGKLAKALRRIGFNKVYDVNISADITIVEESKELINRIKNNGKLPLFTSCCPAWYKFVVDHYPDYIDNLSTCKSPNEMLAALVQYKHKVENSNRKLRIVSIMPCTAKKFEIVRDSAIDSVLTTRELAEMIKAKNINFNSLKDDVFDSPFEEYSGAGLIFGATGGVMEAALRTAGEMLTGKKIDNTQFEVVRKSSGIKELSLTVSGINLNVAIVNGLENAKQVMDEIKKGRKIHFMEVMTCPGGCVNGGGQPLVDYNKISVEEVIKARSESLYSHDAAKELKTSHDNPSVLNIYKDLLKNDDHLIHQLLHIDLSKIKKD